MSDQTQTAIDRVSRLIDKFVKRSENLKVKSEWLEYYFENEREPLKIYVRKSVRYFDNKYVTCFDFANIDIPKIHQKKGIFKNLLQHVRSKKYFDYIYVECVSNEYLESFLIREHFKVQENCGTPKSFYLKTSKSIAEKINERHILA